MMARYHLLPANPNYPVIRPKGKLEIFSVLVAELAHMAKNVCKIQAKNP